MTTDPEGVRLAFLADIAQWNEFREGTRHLTFELRHRTDCRIEIGKDWKTGEATYCNPVAHVETLHWKDRDYAVAVPDCRLDHTRKIIGTMEEFGCDVGWFSRGNYHHNIKGILYESGYHGITETLKRWFPTISSEQIGVLRELVEQRVQPATTAGYSRGHYYWLRDIARVIRRTAKRRGRLRCLWCRRIFPWDQYEHGPKYHPYRNHIVWVCDKTCHIAYSNALKRQEQQRRRDEKWLQKGKETLGEIKRRLRQQAREAPSPRPEASGRGTTSRT